MLTANSGTEVGARLVKTQRKRTPPQEKLLPAFYPLLLLYIVIYTCLLECPRLLIITVLILHNNNDKSPMQIYNTGYYNNDKLETFFPWYSEL